MEVIKMNSFVCRN